MWGLLYLLVSGGVSAGENVGCICCFIQEIGIEVSAMNRAGQVPALVELCC